MIYFAAQIFINIKRKPFLYHERQTINKLMLFVELMMFNNSNFFYTQMKFSGFGQKLGHVFKSNYV